MQLRIKDILKKKGITAISFATDIGMTQANLSNIITGKTVPPLPTLQKIATALDVELWELFTESTNKGDLFGYLEYKGNIHRITSVEDLKALLSQIENTPDEK